MAPKASRPGRPTLHGRAMRGSLTLRIQGSTRKALEAAAKRAGRSLAAEAELRLEISLACGSLPTAAMVFSILQAGEPPVPGTEGKQFRDFTRRVLSAAPGTTAGRLQEEVQARLGEHGMARLRQWLEVTEK
jgi:hypothetical protein